MRKVLMVDVGGSSVKLMTSGDPVTVRKFDSGKRLTAKQMVRKVRELTADWRYDAVSLAYPGHVGAGKPTREPLRVGDGWLDFDYEQAFGRPVRIINDAAMQALAAYRDGRMLFIGLGSGVGSTLIADDIIVPLELGALRLKAKQTLLDRLCEASLDRLGTKRWQRDVHAALEILREAFWPDEIVLGGGNADEIDPLPDDCRRRGNEDALLGAQRLWGDIDGIRAVPFGTTWRIERARKRGRPRASRGS